LGGEVSQLKGFLEKRFIKVEGNLHRMDIRLKYG
jgi:hypothetical protein